MKLVDMMNQRVFSFLTNRDRIKLKIFHLALIFVFLVAGTVSAIQDHPIELGRTTPKWEDVVQNSQVSSQVSSPMAYQNYNYQTSVGNVFFALPAGYQAKIIQNGDSFLITNTTDQAQKMSVTVVNMKNSLVNNEKILRSLWDVAMASGELKQLYVAQPSKMLDGGYMIVGQASMVDVGLVWEDIKSIDSDGDGKINYAITAIHTMDPFSAGFIVGSIIVNQGSSTNTGYTTPQLHQEPYVGPTYAAGPNLLDTVNSNAIPTTTVQSGHYPADSNTKVYHEPGCTWAGKIKPEHLVWFSSHIEAEAAGYRHCEKC